MRHLLILRKQPGKTRQALRVTDMEKGGVNADGRGVRPSCLLTLLIVSFDAQSVLRFMSPIRLFLFVLCVSVSSGRHCKPSAVEFLSHPGLSLGLGP